MRLKIRCDEESEKFCKIFWELNKAQAKARAMSHFLAIAPRGTSTTSNPVPPGRHEPDRTEHADRLGAVGEDGFDAGASLFPRVRSRHTCCVA